MTRKEADARRAALIYDGEDVERCRQARRDFEKRFKTFDEMFDYCERLRKRRGAKTARVQAYPKTRAVTSRAKQPRA
ncbi:MAG TPA: hypothetical protein VGP72_30525 [Planctomycetota bacterium]|jgi:hypothetical protein